MNKKEIKQALEQIRSRAGDGLLKPDDVVRAARRENHPLHRFFTWDNDQAAHQYRLFQARTLIRSVRLSVPDGSLTPPAPAYVALKADVSTGGGYRRTEEIVDDVDLLEALKETALAELRGWVKRYRALTALTGEVAAAAGLEEMIAEAV